MRYLTHYVHKIAPRDTDAGDPVDLSPTDLADKRSLGAALRRAGILHDAIENFRIEKNKVVVFPEASIWHSIILHLPGTAALSPKKTGPDTYRHFAFKPPIGSKGRLRWFRASAPVTWAEARDRLISKGVINAAQKGWSLSVDPHDYADDRAESLP